MYATWQQAYAATSSASGSHSSEVYAARSMEGNEGSRSKVIVPFSSVSVSGGGFSNAGNGVINVLHSFRTATITFTATLRNAYNGGSVVGRTNWYNFNLLILRNGVQIGATWGGTKGQYDDNGGRVTATASCTVALNANDKISFQVYFTYCEAVNNGEPTLGASNSSFSIQGTTY